MRLRRRTLIALLTGWAILGLGVVFLPIGPQIGQGLAWLARAAHWLGFPPSVDLYSFDFLLNVVLFAVPVMLVATMWPRVPRWLWPLAGIVASFCIEMVQGLFLPRTSSPMDWIANSLGALLGVVAVALLERFRPAPARVPLVE